MKMFTHSNNLIAKIGNRENAQMNQIVHCKKKDMHKFQMNK